MRSDAQKCAVLAGPPIVEANVSQQDLPLLQSVDVSHRKFLTSKFGDVNRKRRVDYDAPFPVVADN